MQQTQIIQQTTGETATLQKSMNHAGGLTEANAILEAHVNTSTDAPIVSNLGTVQ